MSADSSPSMAPAALDNRRLRDLLTGSVTSIGVTLVIVIVVGLSWVGPDFVSISNLTIIFKYVSIPMIVAAFSGFALLAGVVDLSIGSMLGLSSCICAALLAHGWPLAGAASVAIISCLACGGINAIAVVIFGADTIAATLGMLVGLRGVNFILTAPRGSIPAFDVGLFTFTNTTFGPFPILFLIALALMAIATVIVVKARVGRHVQAVGGDERAAGRAGIRLSTIRFVALLLSALGAAIGGIFYVGTLGSTSNFTGTGLEFQVYAAMMIGGYSIMRGGVGNPLGAAFGLLVVAGTANILDVQAISPYYANIIVGLLLLGAVLLDRFRGGDSYE